MAGRLSALGGWAFSHPRRVLAAWLAVLVAIAVAAAVLRQPTDDSFTVPGTEAQRALTLLDNAFPGAGGATARLVFAAPRGRLITAAGYRRIVPATVTLAGRVPQSLASGRAFASTLRISPDRRIAYADLHFVVSVDRLRPATLAALRAVAAPARRAGLEVAFSGGVITATHSSEVATELIGLLVAFAILLAALGSLTAAMLPLISALVSVAIGVLGLSAMSGLTTLNSTAPTLATMLGLAVGIDYGLFITARHRSQLQAGADGGDSIRVTVGATGSAVVVAAVTVVVALVSISLLGIPFLTVMGLGAAGTVLVAVAASLTLVPALLGLAGDRIAAPPRRAGARSLAPGWARRVTGAPTAAIVGVVVVLGAIAIPVGNLRLALPDDSTQPHTSTQYRAYELLAEGFGPGFDGPLTVVALPGGVRRRGPVLSAAPRELGSLPDVSAVSPPTLGPGGHIAVVVVTPRSAPASPATATLVGLIRRRARQAAARYGLRAYVTGQTAVDIDTSARIAARLPILLIAIVGIALVLLSTVFRSLAIPITAMLGFLLTIGAAAGVTTAVFQDGHGSALLGAQGATAIVSFLPVLLVSILFGLAMDYEILLVSRIREAYLAGSPPTAAIRAGVSASARVVSSAALIMFSVFATFAVTGTIIVKEIALGLAAGVLFDAFFVRMTFIPGTLALLGRRAWSLPRAIDRRLPHLEPDRAAPAPRPTEEIATP